MFWATSSTFKSWFCAALVRSSIVMSPGLCRSLGSPHPQLTHMVPASRAYVLGYRETHETCRMDRWTRVRYPLPPLAERMNAMVREWHAAASEALGRTLHGDPPG